MFIIAVALGLATLFKKPAKTIKESKNMF